MAFSFTAVIVSGRIGNVRTGKTASGSAYANISIGLSKWKDGKNENAGWVNVTIWGRQAENPALVKGAEVYVSGELQERKWTGKDGTEGKELCIVARAAHVREDRQRQQSQPAPAARAESDAKHDMADDEPAGDDIPF